MSRTSDLHIEQQEAEDRAETLRSQNDKALAIQIMDSMTDWCEVEITRTGISEERVRDFLDLKISLGRVKRYF